MTIDRETAVNLLHRNNHDTHLWSSHGAEWQEGMHNDARYHALRHSHSGEWETPWFTACDIAAWRADGEEALKLETAEALLCTPTCEERG